MKKAAAIITAFGLPMLALAQDAVNILTKVAQIINIATVIVVALALLFFLWGLAMYLFNGPGEKADEGRRLMVWGVVALFVMVAVWGLVRVIATTLGVGTGGSPPIPGVNAVIGSGGSVTGTNW